MKVFLFIIGVLFGVGGLVFSPQGFIGIAFMVCGAVFFAAGGVIIAIEEVGEKVEQQGKAIRDNIRLVEWRIAEPTPQPAGTSSAKQTAPDVGA